MMLKYMALNENEGELFKGDFWKLFQLEQNPLYNSIRNSVSQNIKQKTAKH